MGNVAAVRSVKPQPVALTIAGSDSGGGAGIQADLKTFAAIGVHGATAITCVTAQNPREVRAIEAISPKMVSAQMQAVFRELTPGACKTGMLYSVEIITEVARFFRANRSAPLVVDPVMIATSGRRLLQRNALRALKGLLPLAALVTPNLDETGLLLDRSITSEEEMRAAAKELHAEFGCAVLVKGGHLRGSRSAVDIFFDGVEELLLSAPYFRGRRTHGTGCAYSAAITACLAKGAHLAAAVKRGKEFVTQAIEDRRV